MGCSRSLYNNLAIYEMNSGGEKWSLLLMMRWIVEVALGVAAKGFGMHMQKQILLRISGGDAYLIASRPVN